MRRIPGGLPLSALLCAAACSPATAANPPDALSGPPPTEGTALREVIVTGSRIPVGSLGSTVPLTVIDKEAIERGGEDTLGRILQALPFSTPAMNTNVNNGGDGSERLDLRGLSPKRTLLLLNGHRLPNGGLGGDDSVDLGMIPLSLIDRIEVQTSGASAVYGADAVAGVVNVITRQAAPLLEATLKDTVTERGDGRITAGQLVGGREIAGGNWLAGADFTQQKPVTMDARGYSAVPLQFVSSDFALGPGSSRTTPDGRFFVPGGNAFGLDPGPYNRIPGSTGQSAANYLRYDPNNPYPSPASLFNYAPYNYLQTPFQRESIWLLGSQPLAHDLTLFTEGLWYTRKSSQRLAPTPYSSGSDPAPLLPDGSIGIPADNWYNPFGVPVFNVRRRFAELPDRTFQQAIEGWRALAGVRGVLQGWHWEFSLAQSRSRATAINTGLPSALRLVPAIGPSGPDAAGQIVCGSRDASGIVPAANIIPGCVPVNLFGGQGSITPDQAQYLDVTLTDHGSDAQTLASLTAEGQLGTLPDGPVSWSVGTEYRRESGELVFDPAGRAGVISVVAQSDIANAHFDAREVYLEARLPVLKDRPAANALEATAGIRYSRFSSFGSDSTWMAGINYQPVRSVSFRANYAQVLRVPDLQELYQAQVKQRTVESDDPCGNDPSAVQRANCAAHGVPGGSYQENPLDEWDNLVGGNAALAPERGSSFDAGVDFAPTDWPHVKLNLDFFEVELNGYIETPSTLDVLTECADRGTPAVCAQIHRAADGTLLQVDTIASNFGRAVSSGFDFGARFDLDALASRLSFGGLATYLARRDTQPFSGGAITRGAGLLVDNLHGFPHLRAKTFAELRRPAWHVSYSLQYIGPYSACGDLGSYLLVTDCYRIGSRLYHDLEGGIVLHGALELRGGVTNLTNANPPFVDVSDGNTDTAAYRLLGRTYFAGLRYRFD